MLRAPAIALVLASCYSPRVTPGVACVSACPGNQVCVDGVCRDPGDLGDDAMIDVAIDVDAPIDGSPDIDTDGDGLFDDVDNCVAVANLDQHDEDTDDLGDSCDPCPHVATGAAMDSDADGVGDACDPEPMNSRQRWRVFDPFTSRASAWTMSSAATFGADAMTLLDGSIRHTITLNNFRVQLGGELTVTNADPQQMVLEVSHQNFTNYYYGEFFGDSIDGYMKITRRAGETYGTIDDTGYTGSIPGGPFAWTMDVSVAAQTIAFLTRHGATEFRLLAGSATTTHPLTTSAYLLLGTSENIAARLDYFAIIETLP